MDDALDRTLDALEELYESESLEEAWRLLRDARQHDPAEPTLIEWEAVLLEEEGRGAQALRLLDELLERKPGRSFALEARAGILMGLGRYAEVLEQLRRMERMFEDPADRAWICFQRGLCLDRQGREREADREFASAAELDPGEFTVPPRMDDAAFEALVHASLKEIPEDFRRHLDQVALTIADYPSTDSGIGNDLFGLYLGVPRTERRHEDRDHFDRILIFKRNLELAFDDRDDLADEIRKTVIHEIGHHFGLDHESMGDFV